MFGSGTTTLEKKKNKKIDDIVKIVKYLEESGLLIKGVSKTIKNEAKEQKGVFLGMLLESLGASSLGNLLMGKGAMAASQERSKTLASRANMPGRGAITAGESTVKTVQDFKCRFIL